MSFVRELNGVTSGGYSVTVSGLSFGSLDVTPSMRLGTTLCATSAWASSSSVRCLLVEGAGTMQDVDMTVAGVIGTRTSIFSYDGQRSTKNVALRKM